MKSLINLFKFVGNWAASTAITFLTLLFGLIVFGIFASVFFFCQGCTRPVQAQNVYMNGIIYPKIPVVLKSVDTEVTVEDLVHAANWWNDSFEEMLGCNEDRYRSPYCEDDINIVEVNDNGWVPVSTSSKLHRRVGDVTTVEWNKFGRVTGAKIVLNKQRWNQWILIHGVGHTLGLANDKGFYSIMNEKHGRNMYGKLSIPAFVQLKSYVHRVL
jgi:hypothetical protein